MNRENPHILSLKNNQPEDKEGDENSPLNPNPVKFKSKDSSPEKLDSARTRHAESNRNLQPPEGEKSNLNKLYKAIYDDIKPQALIDTSTMEKLMHLAHHYDNPKLSVDYDNSPQERSGQQFQFSERNMDEGQEPADQEDMKHVPSLMLEHHVTMMTQSPDRKAVPALEDIESVSVEGYIKDHCFTSDAEDFHIMTSQCFRWTIVLGMKKDSNGENIHISTNVFRSTRTDIRLISPGDQVKRPSKGFNLALRSLPSSIGDHFCSHLKHVSMIPNTSYLTGIGNKSGSTYQLYMYDLNGSAADMKSSRSTIDSEGLATLKFFGQKSFACYLPRKRIFDKKNPNGSNSEAISSDKTIVGCIFGHLNITNGQLSNWKGHVFYYMNQENDEKTQHIELSDGQVRFDEDVSYLDEFCRDGNNKLSIFFLHGCKELVVYGLLADKIKNGIVSYQVRIEKRLESTQLNLVITDIKIKKRYNLPEEVAYGRDNIETEFNLLDPELTLDKKMPSLAFCHKENNEMYQIVFSKNTAQIALKEDYSMERPSIATVGNNANIVTCLAEGADSQDNVSDVHLWLRESYGSEHKKLSYIKAFSLSTRNTLSILLSADYNYLWMVIREQNNVLRLQRHLVSLCNTPTTYADFDRASGTAQKDSKQKSLVLTNGQVIVTVNDQKIEMINKSMSKDAEHKYRHDLSEDFTRRVFEITEVFSERNSDANVKARGSEVKMPALVSHELIDASCSNNFSTIYMLYRSTRSKEASFDVDEYTVIRFTCSVDASDCHKQEWMTCTMDPVSLGIKLDSRSDLRDRVMLDAQRSDRHQSPDIQLAGSYLIVRQIADGKRCLLVGDLDTKTESITACPLEVQASRRAEAGKTDVNKA